MTSARSRDPQPFPIPAPADDLCLRFVNTLYWRGSRPPTETMLTPNDLGHFLLTEVRLPAVSVGDADALARGLVVREMLHRLLAAQAQRRDPDPADLARFNQALREGPARAEVSLTPDGRSWLTRGDPDGIGTLLAPILWSAADLMLGPRADRVRQCDNPACGWLFLDDSKGGNRRWCAMSACGNRAKARRHYAKVKARASGETG